MEPPNKGHVGDNINSAVLSFIERLSSYRGSECTKTIGHVIFGTSSSVERFIIQCPYFGGSTIGDSTVVWLLSLNISVGLSLYVIHYTLRAGGWIQLKYIHYLCHHYELRTHF